MFLKRSFAFEVLMVVLLFGSGLAKYLWGFHRSLDARFFYSQDEAIQFFKDLTFFGDWAPYVRQEFFDFLFIIAYSALFFRVLGVLFLNSYFKYLGLVPGLLDVIETGTILGILLNTVSVVPLWLGFVTSAKWVASGLVLLSVTVAIVKRKFFKP